MITPIQPPQVPIGMSFGNGITSYSDIFLICLNLAVIVVAPVILGYSLALYIILRKNARSIIPLILCALFISILSVVAALFTLIILITFGVGEVIADPVLVAVFLGIQHICLKLVSSYLFTRNYLKTEVAIGSILAIIIFADVLAFIGFYFLIGNWT